MSRRSNKSSLKLSSRFAAAVVWLSVLALLVVGCNSARTNRGVPDRPPSRGTDPARAPQPPAAAPQPEPQTAEPEREPEAEPEAQPEPVPELHAQLSATSVAQGDFLVLELTAPAGMQVTAATVGGWEPAPRPYAVDDKMAALVPVSYYTAPGTYELTWEATVTAGDEATPHTFHGAIPFTVTEKQFDTSHVYLDEATAALPSDPQVALDYERLRQLREQPTPEPLWRGPFIQPTDGWVSTDFGEIRYVNDIESGRHNGIDFANDAGTPIFAANNGKVILADYLVMTGYTVVIDHGMGLYSSYSHLAELAVEAGQMVAKGDQVGLMGSTGFSTGPHLHFVMNIFHEAVNPWLFLESDPLSRTPQP